MSGTLQISNPGSSGPNNWAPSFGHRKVDLAAEVRRALKRKPCGNPPKPKYKPTTLRGIKAELKRQAARIGKPDGTAISAAGRVRTPVWEHETYNLWMERKAA
ncbi:MAG: hypothetical protein V3R16_09605 [Nitrospirales bacterium]